MDIKTERWNLRVTPAQDAAVRRVLSETGESLNEFVVRHAVQAASSDLADRTVFVLDADGWTELQEILDRPATGNAAVAKLLSTGSVLDR